MQEFWDMIGGYLNKIPTVFVFMLVLIWAVGRFGPVYVSKLNDVAKRYQEKSEKIKNEYIALLEAEKERKDEEIKKLKARLKTKNKNAKN